MWTMYVKHCPCRNISCVQSYNYFNGILMMAVLGQDKRVAGVDYASSIINEQTVNLNTTIIC